MKCGLLALFLSFTLGSCVKQDQVSPAPASSPPEGVSMAFSRILGELLPDSHENLSTDPKPQEACRSVHTNYSSDNNIIETIVEAAKNHRLVIVNEAHNRASHRAFTLRLAEGLQKEGYTIFAAEAFNTPPGFHETRQDALYRRGYALKGDGYYTVEPVFGQTVRRVLELGYRPIFYEIEASPADVARKDRIEIRKTAQAENLIRRAIEKYPHEKILVHVGFSHGKELPDSSGNIWMGMRIKAATGIDPLTVSQTACEGGDVDEGVARLKNLENPSVLHTEEGYDMLVLHPRVQYENGRGTWLKSVDRKFVAVPKILQHSSEWRYIAAHKLPYSPVDDLSDMVTNSKHPVVYDSLLLGPGQKHDLALEIGHYVVASYNDALQLQGQTKLRVE